MIKGYPYFTQNIVNPEIRQSIVPFTSNVTTLERGTIANTFIQFDKFSFLLNPI